MKTKNNDWEDEFDWEEGSDNKSLLRFLHKLLVNWYWFVLLGGMGFGLAYIKMRYTIPMYKVSAKLLVSDDKKGGGVSSMALGDLSGLMGGKSSVDNEVEILRTGDLMREMVLAEQAFVSYFKVGKVHNIPVLKTPYRLELLSLPDSISKSVEFTILLEDGHLRLSSPALDLKVQANRSFDLPGVGRLIIYSVPFQEQGEVFGFRIAPLRKMVGQFRNSLTVAVTNKNVSTIDLTMQHALPALAERYLASLIEQYVARNLHDKNVIADSTLSFIYQRLDKVTTELSNVEDRISGYKQKTKLADISEQSRILLQNSADYTKSIAELETQLAALEGMSAYLKDTSNPRVIPSTSIVTDPAFAALVNKYNELVLQRERLLLANTEQNPLVQNVNVQLAGLREDMINSLGNTAKQLMLSKQKHSQLSNQFSSQIQQVPTIERGYVDLARLQQIKQAQYIFLQEKWEETAIGRTANVSNSKLIDSPRAAQQPFAPNKKMFYMLGLMLGMAVPLLFIYLKDLFNVRVQDINDVKQQVDLPILGMIAHSKSVEQVVVSKSSRSAIAEQFRVLRTNLEFVLQGGNTVMFTSSMSGEGKSYAAINLAVTLALLDKKVVLVECDMRKPSLSSKLGVRSPKGLSHYIVRQEIVPADIIVPSGAHAGVDFISAGTIPPNPAELLQSPRAQELVQRLKEKYDYVLLDTPPIGMVTDAQLLSPLADICLYMVRQGVTYKEQLEIPAQLRKRKKIKSIQLILNDVKMEKRGYYERYGYGYGYGYGEQPSTYVWWKFWKK